MVADRDGGQDLHRRQVPLVPGRGRVADLHAGPGLGDDAGALRPEGCLALGVVDLEGERLSGVWLAAGRVARVLAGGPDGGVGPGRLEGDRRGAGGLRGGRVRADRGSSPGEGRDDDRAVGAPVAEVGGDLHLGQGPGGVGLPDLGRARLAVGPGDQLPGQAAAGHLRDLLRLPGGAVGGDEREQQFPAGLGGHGRGGDRGALGQLARRPAAGLRRSGLDRGGDRGRGELSVGVERLPLAARLRRQVARGVIAVAARSRWTRAG